MVAVVVDTMAAAEAVAARTRTIIAVPSERVSDLAEAVEGGRRLWKPARKTSLSNPVKAIAETGWS